MAAYARVLKISWFLHDQINTSTSSGRSGSTRPSARIRQSLPDRLHSAHRQRVEGRIKWQRLRRNLRNYNRVLPID